MAYRITYRATVKKELRRIHPVMRKAVTKRILSLADDPRPVGVAKLTGGKDEYRLRQGAYRIIYSVYDDEIRIEIIKVGHRSDVYK